jgi:predicted TIM-barrel fold metal-dependent hydrolase
MMRIDAHQHFWVYDQREYAWIDDSMASLRRDLLPHDLKPELERNGFQGSVVVHARQMLEETSMASRTGHRRFVHSWCSRMGWSAVPPTIHIWMSPSNRSDPAG